MNRIKYKSNKGFTLVELLVAVTLLVVAAAAFLPVFTLVSRSNNQNNIRATANAIAAGIYEEINNMDYEKIGNKDGGNPSGDIERFPNPIDVDGVIYEPEVLINWGSTKALDNEIDNVAYKNVRIIVRAHNAFTGQKEIVDKIYSIVAKEGGRSLPDAGNLRATVKQADGLGHEYPVVNISCNGPEHYSMPTDEVGQVLFGEIKKGTYSVSATIPSGWMVAQGFNVTGSTVTVPDVLISEWDVRNVYFYMDRPEKFCWLSMKLVDEANNVIDAEGKMTIEWEIDGEERTVFKNKDFSEGFLDPTKVGRLWPQGTYNIKIEFPHGDGFKNYDMSIDDRPIIEGTEEKWTGTFSDYGETINLVIPVKAGTNYRNPFSKIEAESYNNINGSISTENCTDTGDTKNLKITGKSNNYTIYEFVNFKGNIPSTFQVRAAATGNENSKITVKLHNQNGSTIGNLYVTSTGSLDKYKTFSCVITNQEAIQDAINQNTSLSICLVFEPNSELRINWFKFSKALDDFNDNKIDHTRWSLSGDGTWVEEAGVFKQTNMVVGDDKKAMFTGVSYTGHYTVIGKVRLQNWRTNFSEPRAGLSLFAGFEGDGNNVYSLDFFNNRSTRGRWNTYRGIMVNNTQKESDQFNLKTRSWYWFVFSSNKIGNQVRFTGKIWPDGENEPNWQYTRTENSTNFTGYPALNSGFGNCELWFDDISVIDNDSTE